MAPFLVAGCLVGSLITEFGTLAMSAGAMLLRIGNESVLVHRTAPVMVLMMLFSCAPMRLVYVKFFQSLRLEHIPVHRVKPASHYKLIRRFRRSGRCCGSCRDFRLTTGTLRLADARAQTDN